MSAPFTEIALLGSLLVEMAMNHPFRMFRLWLCTTSGNPYKVVCRLRRYINVWLHLAPSEEGGPRIEVGGMCQGAARWLKKRPQMLADQRSICWVHQQVGEKCKDGFFLQCLPFRVRKGVQFLQQLHVKENDADNSACCMNKRGLLTSQCHSTSASLNRCETETTYGSYQITFKMWELSRSWWTPAVRSPVRKLPQTPCEKSQHNLLLILLLCFKVISRLLFMIYCPKDMRILCCLLRKLSVGQI